MSNTRELPTLAHTQRFRLLAILSLFYTLGVIVYGAWVRVSFSGAGCGQSWPMCNGSALPTTDNIETLIEFTHRVTSGLSLVIVVVLLVLAIQWFPKGHLARKWAWLSVIFMVMEALLGAGLVLFELVVHNDSVFRAISMTAHLVNTSLLTACMVSTAFWGGIQDDTPQPIDPVLRVGIYLAMAALLITSMTGAITALGDTLFPPESTRHAISASLEATSHFLVRLRLLHPIIAMTAGVIVAIIGTGAAARADIKSTRTWGIIVVTLVFIQVMMGFANIALSAPAWMQLLHLGSATTLWCCTISLWLHLRQPATLEQATIPTP